MTRSFKTCQRKLEQSHEFERSVLICRQATAGVSYRGRACQAGWYSELIPIAEGSEKII